MRVIFYRLVVFVLILMSQQVGFASQFLKPRVIVMTDGEIDDRSSMVRFLLYTNDIELISIIQTNSAFQRNGWSKDKWIEHEIDAYEKVYPNLIIHSPSYPTAETLRSKLLLGDEDESHLGKTWDWNPPMGKSPLADPSNWADTPGSEKIVETLLQDDPRPVYIQAWGGGNTAARAFYKLKSQFPNDYDRAISKVVMYNILYQDQAGPYIEKYHPKVTMLFSNYFSGSWAYGDQKYTYQFIKEVKETKGALAALYPQNYVSEGDSPSFLYSLDNGLRSYEDPTNGGWGGQFYKLYGKVYKDVSKGSYTRWIEYANRDFEARLNWCIANKYEEANHKPVIKVLGDELNRTCHSGDTVKIVTEITDPDGQGVMVDCWQFKEAGTYESYLNISKFSLSESMIIPGAKSRERKITFIAPDVAESKTVHLIIEAKDGTMQQIINAGKESLNLTSFQRVIVTVIPK